MAWSFREYTGEEPENTIPQAATFMDNQPTNVTAGAKLTQANSHEGSARTVIFFDPDAPASPPHYPGGESCLMQVFVCDPTAPYESLYSQVTSLLNSDYIDPVTGHQYILNTSQAFWAQVSMCDGHGDDPYIAVWYLKDER